MVLPSSCGLSNFWYTCTKNFTGNREAVKVCCETVEGNHLLISSQVSKSDCSSRTQIPSMSCSVASMSNISRMSIMSTKVSSSGSSTAINVITPTVNLVNLHDFCEDVEKYTKTSDADSLVKLTANLHLIYSIRDHVAYDDTKETSKYFDALLKLMNSEFPEINTIYRTLKVASENESGLEQLQNNPKLMQHLFANIPEINSIFEFHDWPLQKTQNTVMLLKVLSKITEGYTLCWEYISLQQILKPLSCLFLTLCDDDSKPDIPFLCLAIMLNVCRANIQFLSHFEYTAMGGKKFVQKLLLKHSEQSYEPSFAHLDEAGEPMEITAYCPLLAIHLMLILERVAAPVPETKLLAQVNSSFKTLVDAIDKKCTQIIYRAAAFLTDLCTLEHKRDFVLTVHDYVIKFKEIVDALFSSGHIEPKCDAAVIKLLTTMFPLLPRDMNDEMSISLLRNVLIVCAGNLNKFTTNLESDEGVDCVQVEMAELVLTLASVAMSRIENFDDYREELTDIIQPPLSILQACSRKEVEEMNIYVTDMKCLSAAMKLLSQFGNMKVFSSKFAECDDMIDCMNKSFAITPPGKISAVVVAYLNMLASVEEWEAIYNHMISLSSTCEHIAFAMKHGDSMVTTQAALVLAKMPAECVKLVSDSMKIYTMCPQANESISDQTISLYSEKDASRLDFVLQKLQENNPNDGSNSSIDKDNCVMITMVEAMQLQIQDFKAQIALQNKSLDSLTTLATHRQQLLNKLHDEKEQMAVLVIQAEKRSWTSEQSVHKLQKILKTSEKENVTYKQELDKMFASNLEEKENVQKLTAKLEEKSEKLKLAEELHSGAEKNIEILEKEKTAMEEKLGRFRKDSTSLKHKNGTLTKECEALKAENKSLTKDKEQLTEQLEELKRIRDMVAKLTSASDGPKL